MGVSTNEGHAAKWWKFGEHCGIYDTVMWSGKSYENPIGSPFLLDISSSSVGHLGRRAQQLPQLLHTQLELLIQFLGRLAAPDMNCPQLELENEQIKYQTWLPLGYEKIRR